MANSPHPLVRMTGITKTYPGVQALSNVDFDLLPGEIHCLVGENGAGKSTLVRILAGAEQPDSGTIEIQGHSFTALNPILAHRLGVGIIYQETDLVLKLNVAENIFLGHEPVTASGMLDRRQMIAEAQAILARMGVQISPNARVRTLNAGNRQLVQIAKALSWDSRILVMDEPGASLSDYELDRLFAMLTQLKLQGIGIIYISHRLGEVLRIGDRVTVLRDGHRIHTAPVAEVTFDNLIRLMVGRPLGEHFGKVSACRDEIVLSARGLTCVGRFTDISFDLHRGEILGLAGLVGAGRSDLLACLFGALQPDGGTFLVEGQPVRFGSPRDAIQKGLGLVPEDRRESGLILIASVQDNIALPILERISRFAVLSFRRLAQIAAEFIERLQIRTPSVKQKVQHLSGGNQQKVVLAKWLAAGVKILLLDEPTRGIDIGAKSEIYRLLNQLVAQGVSIIMASSELPEVIGMSDRILVMAEGRITREFVAQEATQEAIMQYAIAKTALTAAAPHALRATEQHA